MGIACAWVYESGLDASPLARHSRHDRFDRGCYRSRVRGASPPVPAGGEGGRRYWELVPSLPLATLKDGIAHVRQIDDTGWPQEGALPPVSVHSTMIMLHRTLRHKLTLAACSALVCFITSVSAYEAYHHYQYRQWKKRLAESGPFRDGQIMESSNLTLIWEYKPNLPNNVFHTNRWGFRDEDYETKTKPTGTYHLAVIGDSITVGLMVSWDNTFVKKMSIDAATKRPDLALQVMNFGVGGYNVVQIHELLHAKVISFQPDKVVYVMCLNDFDFDDASGDRIRYYQRPTSFFLLKLRDTIRHHYHQEYHRRHFEATKAIAFEEIRQMQSLLASRGIEYQVVILPVFPQALDGQADYPHRALHQDIGQQLDADGIAFFDLLDAFEAVDQPLGHFGLDIWHPNRQGHAIIADALFDKVVPVGQGQGRPGAMPGRSFSQSPATRRP